MPSSTATRSALRSMQTPTVSPDTIPMSVSAVWTPRARASSWPEVYTASASITAGLSGERRACRAKRAITVSIPRDLRGCPAAAPPAWCGADTAACSAAARSVGGPSSHQPAGKRRPAGHSDTYPRSLATGDQAPARNCGTAGNGHPPVLILIGVQARTRPRGLLGDLTPGAIGIQAHHIVEREPICRLKAAADGDRNVRLHPGSPPVRSRDGLDLKAYGDRREEVVTDPHREVEVGATGRGLANDRGRPYCCRS